MRSSPFAYFQDEQADASHDDHEESDTHGDNLPVDREEIIQHDMPFLGTTTR